MKEESNSSIQIYKGGADERKSIVKYVCSEKEDNPTVGMVSEETMHVYTILIYTRLV